MGTPLLRGGVTNDDRQNRHTLPKVQVARQMDPLVTVRISDLIHVRHRRMDVLALHR